MNAKRFATAFLYKLAIITFVIFVFFADHQPRWHFFTDPTSYSFCLGWATVMTLLDIFVFDKWLGKSA